MNHTSVVQAVQPHVELNIFHQQHGRRYTIGETNSVSGQGSHGVSDVFGSALWLVDYCLYIASQVLTPYHRGSVILTWYTDCLEHHENPPPPRHRLPIRILAAHPRQRHRAARQAAVLWQHLRGEIPRLVRPADQQH